MVHPTPDPTFKLASATALRVTGDWDTRDVWRFLSYEVARDPLSLRSHIQRIYLLIDSDDAEHLFGALVDLWIALKDKGPELRATMLEISRAHLSDEHARFLGTSLKTGLNAADTLPVTSGSVLDRSLVGTTAIVSCERLPVGEVAEKPLDEAVAMLQDGQPDAARGLLERALRADPTDEAVAAQLLEIYWRSRDEEGFAATRAVLKEVLGELPPAWQRLKAPAPAKAA